MVAGWLNHKELKIIKGIGKTPTDTLSAEPDPVVVNLMSGTISLEADGWSPAVAAVKNSGVWSDSPLADGRTLLASPVGNVTEKMSIIITDTTYLGVQKQLSNLNLMVSNCRDFWQTNNQVDPVYLMWWASCGVGPQYALLYNIETAVEYLNSPTPSLRVNVSLEREPYWRGLPPGANPKLWTFYVNGQQIGTNKALSDASLMAGTDHLIYSTVGNKSEWSPTAAGAQVTLLSKNYIDIPASSVPGDAPALAEIHVTNTRVTGMHDLYVGLSTNEFSRANHAGNTKANSLILSAGDADLANGATKTVAAVGTGELSNGSAATYYQGTKALALGDTTYANHFLWGINGSTLLHLDRHFMRGTYAIFLRAKAGTDNNTQQARVSIYEIEGLVSGNSITFPDVQLQFIGAGTTFYNHYVGQITFPLTAREAVSLQGYGTQVRENTSLIQVELSLKNTSGAARTSTILDLVFMPMDNFLYHVPHPTGNTRIVVDNTGYFTHGKPEPIALGSENTNTLVGNSLELRGAPPVLMPRVAQRLYFLETNYESPSHNSAPDEVITVRANIIPRWSGIRDA